MAKQAALGTILQLDETSEVAPPGVPAYTPIQCVSSLTPPAREREEVEDRCLGDELSAPVPGGEAPSEMTFVHTWHPQDGDDTRLLALFDSKANAAWMIVYPHESPAKTDEFAGWIRLMTPETLEPTGVYRREVTVRRTGPMTSATASAQMMSAIEAARKAYGMAKEAAAAKPSK